jgi:vacuolar-type H+-ATPase subunit E/Vma4
MKEGIKEIIEADDAAWDAVAKSRAEAARIKAEAQRQAEEIAASQEARLAEAIAGEVQAVLIEAQSKAQQARSEADIYLERLRARKEEVRVDLVDQLLNMVTGQ